MERLWEKVDKSGDCWIWMAGKSKLGYGRLKVDGKVQYAHRVSWFLTHGYYPEKPYQVNHKCNNRGCVRPSHLYEGTPKQNTHDSDIAGTFVGGKYGFKKGENHPNAKFTQEQVDEMKEEYTGEWGEQTRMAKKYGVRRGAISRILSGKRW